MVQYSCSGTQLDDPAIFLRDNTDRTPVVVAGLRRMAANDKPGGRGIVRLDAHQIELEVLIP